MFNRFIKLLLTSVFESKHITYHLPSKTVMNYITLLILHSTYVILRYFFSHNDGINFTANVELITNDVYMTLLEGIVDWKSMY